MPTVLDVTEARIHTDFAILRASQPGSDDGDLVSFAASSPGWVQLEAGTKHARVLIRAERWDERPPPSEGWEDVDELPFEEVPGDGPLVLSGFDPTPELGLDISGLGRGRLQVFARGRHRYQYSTDASVDQLPPEEWLLRVYPDDGPVDPMAGGPRRVAGHGGLAWRPSTPWQATMSGWRSTGWSGHLGSSHGFYLAQLALSSAGAPLTRLELAMRMARWMAPYKLGDADAESLVVPSRAHALTGPDRLQVLSDRDAIPTISDVIDALVGIGLLLVERRTDRDLLIPNPSPQPLWERLKLTDPALSHSRAEALRTDHRRISSSIASAVDWMHDEGLRATPRQMAIRWSTAADDVIGGIRLLGGLARVRADRDLSFDVLLDADEALTLWPISPSRTRVS